MEVRGDEETAAAGTSEAALPSTSQPPASAVLDADQQDSDDEATLRKKKLKLEVELLELQTQWYRKELNKP